MGKWSSAGESHDNFVLFGRGSHGKSRSSPLRKILLRLRSSPKHISRGVSLRFSAGSSFQKLCFAVFTLW